MKKSQFSIFAFFFLGMVMITSCKKDQIEDANPVITSSEDLSLSQGHDDDLFQETEISVDTRGGSSTCPILTFASPAGTFPNVVTIDYGAGCIGRNGRMRKGKLIVNIDKPFSEIGATRIVNPQDFYIDSIKVEGARTWTKLTANSMSRVVTNGKFTHNDGSIGTRTASHVLTQIGGLATSEKTDDSFSLIGTATGVNKKGISYSSTVINPLEFSYGCAWVYKGSSELTVNGKKYTMDWGNGLCDRFASITLPNGTTRTIVLRR
jgi:hypothetical protein